MALWSAGRETVSVVGVLELCLDRKPTQAGRNFVARFLLANGWRRYQQRMGPGGKMRQCRYHLVSLQVSPDEDEW